MPLAELLTVRFRLAARLPSQLDDLRGPVRGVIKLPRYLAWPGLREYDLADADTRRSMYGLLLTQGQRGDIVRYVNGALLRKDWPVIKQSLSPRLGRQCERYLALGPGAAAESG